MTEHMETILLTTWMGMPLVMWFTIMGLPYVAFICFSRNRVKIWKFLITEPPCEKPERKKEKDEEN